MKSELYPIFPAEFVKIHFEPGDILVVDARLVDVDQLAHTQIPGLNFHLPIIPVLPLSDAGVEEAIRAVDLATLKRIVSEMEAKLPVAEVSK